MRRRRSKVLRHPYGTPEEWWRRAREYASSPLLGGQGEPLKFSVTCKLCLGNGVVCRDCDKEQDVWIAATYALAGIKAPKATGVEVSELAKGVFS